MREKEAAEVTGQSAAQVAGGRAVAGRQLSPRPSGGSPTARRLPRSAPPAPGRVRSPPYIPGAAPANAVRPSALTPGVLPPGNESQRPGPECRAWYGAAPPASTVLRIALRATRLRRAVDPGDLCRPGGPDGEGQAGGQARSAANLRRYLTTPALVSECWQPLDSNPYFVQDIL